MQVIDCLHSVLMHSHVMCLEVGMGDGWEGCGNGIWESGQGFWDVEGIGTGEKEEFENGIRRRGQGFWDGEGVGMGKEKIGNGHLGKDLGIWGWGRGIQGEMKESVKLFRHHCPAQNSGLCVCVWGGSVGGRGRVKGRIREGMQLMRLHPVKYCYAFDLYQLSLNQFPPPK